MAPKLIAWIPASLVPVVVIAGALVIPAAADAAPRLPEKTAQEVLALVASSAELSYSGTIEQQSDLGLPDLGSLTSSSSSDSAVSTAMEFLTTSHTARVFVGEPGESRIQILDSLAERDIIRNGDEAWFYSSTTNEATHLTFSGEIPDDLTEPTATPAELTQKLLDTLDPSTAITVGDAARVAGRPVYQLILTPEDDATLVGSVIISVDSETGLPLGVEVNAAGQAAAALSVEFSALDISAPDPALFDFTPPAGATVIEKPAEASDEASSESPEDSADSAQEPVVSGTGWSAIVELPAGSLSAADADTSALLAQALTPVDGGQALETSLVSMLLTSDGRVFVGAVSVEQLLGAAE